MQVYLDDMRDPPGNPHDWIVLRSFYELVGFVHETGLFPIRLISFDHDLGDSYGRPLKTGYDAAVWLTEFSEDDFCPDFQYQIHSSNPVGRENIRQLMNRHFERTRGETASREKL